MDVPNHRPIATGGTTGVGAVEAAGSGAAERNPYRNHNQIPSVSHVVDGTFIDILAKRKRVQPVFTLSKLALKSFAFGSGNICKLESDQWDSHMWATNVGTCIRPHVMRNEMRRLKH